ncbi:hypothetical protein BH09PSE5_BH09PSE5_28360 [soil metagenome]
MTNDVSCPEMTPILNKSKVITGAYVVTVLLIRVIPNVPAEPA